MIYKQINLSFIIKHFLIVYAFLSSLSYTQNYIYADPLYLLKHEMENMKKNKYSNLTLRPFFLGLKNKLQLHI